VPALVIVGIITAPATRLLPLVLLRKEVAPHRAD
jgi:hypothetical protein